MNQTVMWTLRNSQRRKAFNMTCTAKWMSMVTTHTLSGNGLRRRKVVSWELVLSSGISPNFSWIKMENQSNDMHQQLLPGILRRISNHSFRQQHCCCHNNEEFP